MHVPPDVTGDRDSESGQYVVVVVPVMEQMLLAVGASDQFTLKHHDLNACTAYGDMRYCPEMNVFRRKKAEGCLGVLYNGDQNAISTICRWKVGPASDYALQLTAHDFLLFQADKRPVRRSCPGQEDVTEVMGGARRIQLPAQCSIVSNSFKFEGQLDTGIIVPSYSYTIHEYNFSTALLKASDGQLGDLEHLHHPAPAGNNTDHGMTINLIASDFQQRKTQMDIVKGISVVFLLLLLTIGIFLNRHWLGFNRAYHHVRALWQGRRFNQDDVYDHVQAIWKANAPEMVELQLHFRTPSPNTISDTDVESESVEDEVAV
jgi:hypothetical protein